MRTLAFAFAIIGTAGLMSGLMGCGDDEETAASTTTAASTGTPGGTGGTGSTSTGNGGTGGTGSTGSGGSADYAFDTTPFDQYVQTDRHGAVEAGTVGIAATSGLGLNGRDIAIRDQYNASNPVEDAAGMWVGEISDSLTALHSALDDDLTGAGLTPATLDQSLAQAGPVVVPDTIKFDPTKPVAYPNGRALTDQVVDITVAAALVDLSGGTPLSVLADLPLNPAANDVPFKAAFPYLADPH
jgi:hypothetical protein